MDFTWYESIIYGIINGLTEFLPVSSVAHRAIFLKIFGAATEGYLLRLMVHMGILAALLSACRGQINHMKKEQSLAKIPPRRRKRQPDQRVMLDLRILKTAAIPILLGFVIYYHTYTWENDLLRIALFLFLNGIVLFIPRVLPSGNKDSRSISIFDSILMGLCGALGMVAGLSRIGLTTSAMQIRGADRQHAYGWSLMLSIPVLIIIIGIDIFGLFSVGAGPVTLVILAQNVLAAIAAYFSAFGAITLMRFMAVEVGYSGFAYYSWGAALYALILFLTA